MKPPKWYDRRTAEAGPSQARPGKSGLIPGREDSTNPNVKRKAPKIHLDPAVENTRQISHDMAKVFKDGAERHMAASKLKHEIEYLRETTALFYDLRELQNREFPCSATYVSRTSSFNSTPHSFPSSLHQWYTYPLTMFLDLPVWDLPARPFFERLRLAVVGVNQAAEDLQSYGDAQGKFEKELTHAADRIGRISDNWTKGDDSGCGGDVLGLRTLKEDMTSNILIKEADSTKIEILLDTVDNAFERWVQVGQEKMERYAKEAKGEWKTESKNDARELAAEI